VVFVNDGSTDAKLPLVQQIKSEWPTRVEVLEKKRNGGNVLVQPEMEKRRSPLVSIPPFGRGFSRHGGLSSDDFFHAVHSARGLAPALLSIGSMSPAGLSLSMVASPQSPLPFRPARSL
jgi:hypothetical protein